MSYDDWRQELHQIFQTNQLRFEISHNGRLGLLDLSRAGLTQIPPGISQLNSLQELYLDNNQITALPSDIGHLTDLRVLHANDNLLVELPDEICCLARLRDLRLDSNKLTRLHPELGTLRSLQQISVRHNLLRELPASVGDLTQLEELLASDNLLTEIPALVGQLDSLRLIDVSDNSLLLSPPPEIVARGTTAIKGFLRELEANRLVRFEAKLLLVGEGATGKSSLRRALEGVSFDPNLSTTHGIEISRLEMADDRFPDVKMVLNTWDFGGQQIYHATHQFFLTQRSIYLVVWNARESPEQCRLNHWLDTIQAIAPDAPVLLVATHIDERTPDLNFPLYKSAYPQLIGHFQVSNRTGDGIAELSAAEGVRSATSPDGPAMAAVLVSGRTGVACTLGTPSDR